MTASVHHTAAIVQGIGHYHAARFAAARSRVPSLTVVPMIAEMSFSEFAAPLGDSREFYTPLYLTRKAYREALAGGVLRRRLAEVLNEINPSVVAVSGWAEPESLVAIAWARRHGKGVVMMSESQAGDGARSRLRELIKGRVVKCCDAAFVGGRFHSAYVEALGMPPEHTFLGYDAVDNAHFESGSDHARKYGQALRRELGLPARYILACGRFIPKKNFPRLVAAYGRLLAGKKNVPDLVIIGDGPERSVIEASARAAGVDARVILPGFRGYDLLPAVYGLADLFIHVSLVEQWGLVVNEAASVGLPLVVSRRCGVAAELVVEGENGLLVDPEDVEGIAIALASLLERPADMLMAMGAASRRIVSAWGVERFADGFSAAVAMAGHGAAPWRAWSALDWAIMQTLGRWPQHSVP